MRLKNSWENVYETHKINVGTNENPKMKNRTFLVKHGCKSSPLELKFSKVVKNMKVEKPLVDTDKCRTLWGHTKKE